ncbi:MAG: hypothetical protein J0L77_06645 [Alphaproteobacteria bacterium]|nr:hypothetical protein [Alphaproteobacteria bacterium]
MSVDFSSGIGLGRGDFISSGFNAVGGLSGSLTSPGLTASGPQAGPVQVASADQWGPASSVGQHPGNGAFFPVSADTGRLIVDAKTGRDGLLPGVRVTFPKP